MPKRKADSSRQNIMVDEEGDVILVLETADIKISSSVLAKISPVFRAMFGPGFYEGTQLSTSSPGSVTLPDDDTESMIAICKVAYLQHAAKFELLEPKFLFEITKVADKYECLSTIYLPMRLCLAASFERNKKKAYCAYLLFPTIKFEMQSLACNVLKFMVFCSASSLLASPSSDGTGVRHFRFDDELAGYLPDGWSHALYKETMSTKILVATEMSMILTGSKIQEIRCSSDHCAVDGMEDFLGMFNAELVDGSILDSIVESIRHEKRVAKCANCVSAAIQGELEEYINQYVIDQLLPEFCDNCIKAGSIQKIHDVFHRCGTNDRYYKISKRSYSTLKSYA